MRKTWSLVGAVVILCLSYISALADVTDYIGGNDSSRCPQTIVIKPELSDKNIFYPIDAAKLETASNMIGQAVSNKYPGSTVIAANDLKRYQTCNVPVVLTKLKSYTTESAIFNQHQGKIAVTVLHFPSTAANTFDKTIEVSATGERFWGDDTPFTNAVEALIKNIQKTSF